MPDELTPYLGLTKPEIGSDATWAGKLNANFDLLDTAIRDGAGGSGNITLLHELNGNNGYLILRDEQDAFLGLAKDREFELFSTAILNLDPVSGATYAWLEV